MTLTENSFLGTLGHPGILQAPEANEACLQRVIPGCWHLCSTFAGFWEGLKPQLLPGKTGSICRPGLRIQQEDLPSHLGLDPCA